MTDTPTVVQTVADALTQRDDLALSLNEALDASQQNAAELEAKVAELEAQIKELTRPATVFGTSNVSGTPGLTLPIAAIRTYLQPGERPTVVSQDAALDRAFKSASIVHMSIKEQAGDWTDSLFKDIETRYPDAQVYCTADHEPRDGWWDSGKMAQWIARQEAFEAVLESHPRVRGVTIVEGGNLKGKPDGPAYFAACLRPKQIFGFDRYNHGNPPPSYRTPEEVYGNIFDWMVAQGLKETVVGETGTGPVPTDTDRSGQLQWELTIKEYLADAPVPVVLGLWWNSGQYKLPLNMMQEWLS